jgi:hypothetical protein
MSACRRFAVLALVAFVTALVLPAAVAGASATTTQSATPACPMCWT